MGKANKQGKSIKFVCNYLLGIKLGKRHIKLMEDYMALSFWKIKHTSLGLF